MTDWHSLTRDLPCSGARVSWGADPKGKEFQKRFQKDWMFFKKEVLKGSLAGHPHVLDEEPAGKTLPGGQSFAWNASRRRNL